MATAKIVKKPKQDIPADVVYLLQRLTNSRPLLLHGDAWIEEIQRVLKAHGYSTKLPTRTAV